MYFEISACLTRIHDGVVFKIAPSEFLAWSQLSGENISPETYQMLTEMDAQFCIETQLELNDRREKLRQEAVRNGKR